MGSEQWCAGWMFDRALPISNTPYRSMHGGHRPFRRECWTAVSRVMRPDTGHQPGPDRT